MNTKNNAMGIQPLPGQISSKNVLYVDLLTGHAAVAEAAEHRFFMLETITKILSCAKLDSLHNYDQANLCLTLNTLIEEAHGLHVAAYHLAQVATNNQERSQ